jgi:hypothetical protein
MLASPANVNDFFNGTDFTGWNISSAGKWQVTGGAIIGHGSVDRAEFITSDLTAAAFHFKARVQVSGAGAWAEIAIRGDQREGGYTGVSLRLTPSDADGKAGVAEMVRYDAGQAGKRVAVSQAWSSEGIPVEITAKGGTVNVRLIGGSGANILGGEATDRTNFHFRVFGANAQVKITGLELKVE